VADRTEAEESDWPESEAVDYRYFRPRRNIWSTLLVPTLIMLAFVVFASSYFFKQEKVLDRSRHSAAAASSVKTSDSDFFGRADLVAQIDRLTQFFIHVAASVSSSPGATVTEKLDGILSDYRSSEELLKNANRLKVGDLPITQSIKSLLDASNSSGSRKECIGVVRSGPIPVFFAFNSIGLTPPARQSIALAVARWREKAGAAKEISVEGFADPSGDAGVNKKLSDGRANSVYQELVAAVGSDHVAPLIPKRLKSEKKPSYESYDESDAEYQRVVVISIE
jgi:outer membrane protein OmpA-like peptidoglycan-associated protein